MPWPKKEITVSSEGGSKAGHPNFLLSCNARQKTDAKNHYFDFEGSLAPKRD
jgi:hypothetical protein